MTLKTFLDSKIYWFGNKSVSSLGCSATWIEQASQACPLTRDPVIGKPFVAHREAANHIETYTSRACAGRCGTEEEDRFRRCSEKRLTKEKTWRLQTKKCLQGMVWAESHYLSLFHCGRHLYLCISTDSSNNWVQEVNWGKQSCTPIADALLMSLFGCTHTFYFRGNGGSHGGTLPSQWEEDCWFQLTKNPSLLRTPLHRSVGVLLALVLQCILTTLHTLPTSSKQARLHIAAVKTKKWEEIFKRFLHGRKSNDNRFRKRPMK